jgi:hypothetical protein
MEYIVERLETFLMFFIPIFFVVYCERYAYLKFAVQLETCAVFCQLVQYHFVLGFGGLRVESDHPLK